MAEIESQLQQLKMIANRNTHKQSVRPQIRAGAGSNLAATSDPRRSLSSAKPTGWLCVENRALPVTEIDLLEIIPGRGLHIRTRQESWLISFARGASIGRIAPSHCRVPATVALASSQAHVEKANGPER